MVFHRLSLFYMIYQIPMVAVSIPVAQINLLIYNIKIHGFLCIGTTAAPFPYFLRQIKSGTAEPLRVLVSS